MIMMICDKANDVNVDVDVLLYVSNDRGYDGTNINVNVHDSCDSSFGSLFIIVTPK